MEQMLELAAVTSLSEQSHRPYEGMAFDGQFFYLTLPSELKICRFSRDFIYLDHYQVKRPYSSLCYDSVKYCFWASDDRLPHTVFKLDLEFKETGEVNICKCCTVDSCICSLSFQCESNTILAAYENCVIEISRDGKTTQTVQRTEKDSNVCILSIPPLLILVQRCRQRLFLKIFCREELEKCLMIPDCYKIKSVILRTCCIKEEKLVLFILALDQHSHPCILKCVLDFCRKRLCDCSLCCCKDGECLSIIESIAKSECALARILNAEARKLERAVELTDDICKLLEINRSVQKTITKVTFLEQVLYAKLEAAVDSNVDKCEEK